MFNRGKKPEKLKQFRHRGYSAQDVYNVTHRDEITKAAKAAMKDPSADVISDMDPADEHIAQKDDHRALVGVRQRMLSKMFSDLPASERQRFKTIAEEWTASSAPTDVLRAYVTIANLRTRIINMDTLAVQSDIRPRTPRLMRPACTKSWGLGWWCLPCKRTKMRKSTCICNDLSSCISRIY